MSSVLQFPVSQSSVVEIPLSKGYVALVSAEDAPRVLQHKWSVSIIKGVPYASRGAMQSNGKQSIQYLHRFILQAQPGQHVDHASGNTLDNRRSNIRIATRSQNMANRRKGRNNKTGYTGVISMGKKFQAKIKCQGVDHYLGTFDTAEEAAKARDLKALELFGPYAKTNFTAAELHPAVTPAKAA